MAADLESEYDLVFTRPEDNDRNFLAVYDKKMLWRANLYIDETRASAPKPDWNNQHPWINGNDWNRGYDGVTWNDENPDGGQVVNFQAFNPVRSRDKNNWSNNYWNNTVAYDYPIGNALALDSPFDFVKKLQIEKENIKNHYSNGVYEDSVPMTAGDPVALSILQGWSKTIAPNNRWQNYTRTKSGDLEAYLPGLGLYKHDDDHSNLETGLTTPYPTATYSDSKSAGVDCLGFAQRAAGYDGDNYQWINLPKDTAEGGVLPNNSAAGYREFADLIRNKSQIITDYNSFFDDLISLNKIKPGDIIHYGTDHIGIICNIDLIETDSDPTSITNRIEIIESYYDGKVNYVERTRTILDYEQQGRNWAVIRLKKEQ